MKTKEKKLKTTEEYSFSAKTKEVDILRIIREGVADGAKVLLVHGPVNSLLLMNLTWGKALPKEERLMGETVAGWPGGRGSGGEGKWGFLDLVINEDGEFDHPDGTETTSIALDGWGFYCVPHSLEESLKEKVQEILLRNKRIQINVRRLA